MDELQQQIEAAFDYRGHVTATLKDGSRVVGFLFNRDYGSAQRPIDAFVEFILEGSADKQRVPVAAIQTVSLTGIDTAAGKSYDDWINKKAASATAKS